MKRNKNALEQLLRDPSPNDSKCVKWSDETLKRVKTWDDKNKSRGGWRSYSVRVEKKKHLNYQERTNPNV